MIVKINNLEELESKLEPYRDGYLFRGQVKHYTDDNGAISIPTSFSRHGCVPSVMFKWTHYAKAIIRAFSGVDYFDIDLEMSQAILQHYGWRSFYVDLTKSPEVACWFASNIYNESKSIHMCENLHEDPVWLVHKIAKYEPSDTSGHLYVIDASTLERLGIEIHDLTTLQGDEGRLRFHAQQACLVGNLEDKLPPETISAHFEVPVEILKAYCNKFDLNKVDDVFPPREDDFILHSLLSLPWEKVGDGQPIPAFRRGLEIPDYKASFNKHLPPHVTLYDNFWLSDDRFGDDNPFKNITSFKMPQISFYANTNEEFELDYVNKILDQRNEFVLELDSLVRVIEHHDTYEFEKGIHVAKDENGYVWVSALVVEHPSNIVSGMAVNVGWCYRIDEKTWSKVEHKEQCPCNNDLRHQLHFSLLRMLNESLKTNNFVKENTLSYRDKDIHLN
ncbi:FRG domain-containing protein [Vibrio mediterranei]|uniref:FRG domain-containing protein n=1 Tax=Vibrio mediterranei TaxID=689 RepID=UPI001EFED61D|nr:FRG domain-containing protein [Vibrio mediterranei]MCG9628993.1 FRG domain-containing protein [Vibrio mediterranei]